MKLTFNEVPKSFEINPESTKEDHVLEKFLQLINLSSFLGKSIILFSSFSTFPGESCRVLPDRCNGGLAGMTHDADLMPYVGRVASNHT